MVKRYSLSTDIGGKSIKPNENGALILYNDYKKLEDKYNKLKNSDPYVKEAPDYDPESVRF